MKKLIAFLLALLSCIALASSPCRAIVLGIAQDGGIPQIGCEQPVCRTQHHFVSSLALESEGSLLLIDATPDLREQYRELTRLHPELVRKNLFDGILLTHAHMGHYTGLMFLGKESISAQNVPVYGSSEMTGFLKSNAPWSLLVTNNNIALHVFHAGDPLQLGSFTITPLAVPHRREFTDTHGFLIRGPAKTLLYIPDIDSWEPVRDQIGGWLKAADYALLDGTFYSGKELPGRDMRLVPHPTVENSLAFFGALPAFRCQLFFTHLNHTNPLLDVKSDESLRLGKTPYHVAAEWQEFPM